MTYTDFKTEIQKVDRNMETSGKIFALIFMLARADVANGVCFIVFMILYIFVASI